MNNWNHFQSKYSPLIINHPNTQMSSLLSDWQREAKNKFITINGCSLSFYAKNYHDFNTYTDLCNFFDEVILMNLRFSTNTQKKQIEWFLKSSFHQGGLLCPVSSAFATALVEFDSRRNCVEPFATTGDSQRSVSILSTANGFKVQEFVIVKNLLIGPESKVSHLADENYLIHPDKNEDFIVKLAGTLDVNFSTCLYQPSITIENNSISYGNEFIKSKMDKRHLLQKLIDFIRHLLGSNSIKTLITPVTEDQNYLDEPFTRFGY